MLIMRIVPPQYSAIGMSANDVIYRLLGTFPGLLAFSSVFDASCAKYNYDICVQGEDGMYKTYFINKSHWGKEKRRGMLLKRQTEKHISKTKKARQSMAVGMKAVDENMNVD